ncbi:MAG: tRNA epoxyqueuosine(34) reductase QueG [Hyphomicrobiales bacterium]|nr:MAG: tRNA epoxyqueuosine(34) reductase QueG [Hyphomicrobiales bacterium]
MLSESDLRGSRFLGRDFNVLLREQARARGFDICRITHPSAIPEARERLSAWLASGAAGSMDWLAATQARRSDPRKLWPETASIILLGMNYGPPDDPLAALARNSAGNISVYARNRDYHDLIKGRLKLLAAWLVAQAKGTGVKVFVDTAPVMEKPLAQAAGLGWAGKHSNLVSREFGSWLFLGSIFTDLPLAPDQPESDHCGTCHACLDICPTKAFPRPYVLDARRCISYLTIEHKGHIGREFRPLIGNRIFGCDDCLAVCPWNKFAATAREAKLQAREDLRAPPIADLLCLDDAAFRALFTGSAVTRIGYHRFTRNVLIAAGNSDDPALVGPVAEKLKSPSALVRAMAVWALGRLVPLADLAEFERRWRPGETDETVEAEWAAAAGAAMAAGAMPARAVDLKEGRPP